jgi:hypothetical protein
MNRARLDAILSGTQSLQNKTPAAKPVFAPNAEVIACSAAMCQVRVQRTGARPLVLESQQLPPIF